MAPRRGPWLAAGLAAAAIVAGVILVLPPRPEIVPVEPTPIVREAHRSGTEARPPLRVEVDAKPTAPTVVLVGQHVVEGEIFFDGRPVREFTGEQPQFWLRNEAKGTVQSAGIEYRDGKLKIFALEPGRYGLSVRIDAVKDKPMTWPGDFDSFSTFEVPSEGMVEHDVNLYRIMRLRKPADNFDYVADDSTCAHMQSHEGRDLRFEWDSVGEGVEYAWTIERVACPYRLVGIVAQGRTFDRKVAVDLTPTGENEFYMFSLRGTRDGRMVGGLQVRGKSFLGWDYRFHVR